jgi:pimeloyl-ACP methyl ester carboxylesterase
VIVLPGALAVAANYAALARTLGESFTVHAVERRGRGLSGPQREDYSMVKECEDVAAIQERTQASYLFGHSYGGLIALEVARSSRDFAKVAVYEPGVSVNGSIPMDWMPAYEKNFERGRHTDAFVEFVRATGGPGAARTPHWLMKLILRFMIRGHEREQIAELMTTILPEHREVGRLDNAYTAYATIEADVLLMHGGKGSVAAKETAKLLATVMAHAEVRAFPKLDHFAPDKNAPDEIAQAVRAHFLRD